MQSRSTSRVVIFYSILVFIAVCALASYGQKAVAATNTAFSFYDLTDLGNPRYGEHLYCYTESSASPEAFSVAMPELPGITGFDYDLFEITYQISTVTDEWTIASSYIWIDTDSTGYKDSLQATLTGADANSPVYVLAYDYYRF